VPSERPTGGAPRARRRGFSYRSLPLWLQWVLPFTGAACIVGGLVWYVNHETYDVPALASVSNPSAIVQQNRDARILVTQQQSPHLARLKPGQSPAAGIRAAVVRYMSRQIALGAMDGPIKAAGCRRVGGDSAREVFRCHVTASPQIVIYPFDGVVAPGSSRITFCQRVTPPVPSMNVPVSRRCT